MTKSAKQLCRRLETLKSGESFELWNTIQGLTMQVFGETVYGVSLNQDNEDERAHKLRTAAQLMFHNAGSATKGNFWMASFPFLSSPLFAALRKRFFQAQTQNILGYQAVIDAVAMDAINTRKQNPQLRRGDLVDLLLEARISTRDGEVRTVQEAQQQAQQQEAARPVAADGESRNAADYAPGEIRPLFDDEARDQMNTFLLAGTDTTASSLTFSIFLITQHPEVEKKLLEEIDRLTADIKWQDDLASVDDDVRFDELKNFTYTEQVLSETMRLYPPGVAFTRQAKEDIELEGYKIEKGTICFISAFAIHHNAAYWPQPEVFRPERFDPESQEFKDRSKNPYCYMPFGVGPRMCIGNRYEMKLALITIYRRFTG